jgi:secreted trypsin-like serine protease
MHHRRPFQSLVSHTSASIVALVFAVALSLGAAVRAPVATAAKAHASIVGGAPAQEGAFPSLAYIIDVQGSYVYQCTGTVIAPSLVLTAGHCVENMSTGAVNAASGFRVVTGAVDPTTPGSVVSTVSAAIVYPGLVRKSDVGDAALLALTTPVAAPAIKLAAGPEQGRFPAGSPAVMAGWGIASFGQRLPTEVLQSGTTVVQSDKWCARNAPPFYRKREICTIAPPTYTTGVCSGDSGGPLLMGEPNGEYVEIGVAVHVYDRCSTHHPSVYTSVAAIYSWAQTWIGAYKLSAAPPPASPSAPASPAPSLPTEASPAPAPAPS